MREEEGEQVLSTWEESLSEPSTFPWAGGSFSWLPPSTLPHHFGSGPCILCPGDCQASKMVSKIPALPTPSFPPLPDFLRSFLSLHGLC